MKFEFHHLTPGIAPLWGNGVHALRTKSIFDLLFYRNTFPKCEAIYIGHTLEENYYGGSKYALAMLTVWTGVHYVLNSIAVLLK